MPQSGGISGLCGRVETAVEGNLEESEGFEPSVPLPALRISSATLSTTQPTLLAEEAASSPRPIEMQLLFHEKA